MKNLFTGQYKKRVPKTLNECIKPDGVSTDLWKWAERLERFGAIIFYSIIILGSIIAIAIGVNVYKGYSVIDEDEAILMSFLSIVISVFAFAISAFVEYCIYHSVALLIGALASIVQNTNISANLSLYGIKGKSGDKFSEPITKDKKAEKTESTSKSGDPITGVKLEIVPTHIEENSKMCLVCCRSVPIDQKVCVCGSEEFDVSADTVENNNEFEETKTTWVGTCDFCGREAVLLRGYIVNGTEMGLCENCIKDTE